MSKKGKTGKTDRVVSGLKEVKAILSNRLTIELILLHKVGFLSVKQVGEIADAVKGYRAGTVWLHAKSVKPGVEYLIFAGRVEWGSISLDTILQYAIQAQNGNLWGHNPEGIGPPEPKAFWVGAYLTRE